MNEAPHVPTPGERTRTGTLHLHFERRAGRTVLLHDTQKPPLQIVRPFELTPGTLTVLIVNPTGGTLGGDTYDIRVTLAPGARVVLLTQSAAKIQPSTDGALAQQHARFTVHDGARLEYYPRRLIPFARSRYAQTTTVHLHGTGSYAGTESLTTGRALHGERLQYHELRTRTAVYRDGQVVYLDAFHLRPRDGDLNAPGLLEGRDHLASGIYLGPTPTRPTKLPHAPGELVCGLTAHGDVWIRALTGSAHRLDTLLHEARNALRAHVLGEGPLPDRLL